MATITITCNGAEDNDNITMDIKDTTPVQLFSMLINFIGSVADIGNMKPIDVCDMAKKFYKDDIGKAYMKQFEHSKLELMPKEDAPNGQTEQAKGNPIS